jgi:hypothetical protein
VRSNTSVRRLRPNQYPEQCWLLLVLLCQGQLLQGVGCQAYLVLAAGEACCLWLRKVPALGFTLCDSAASATPCVAWSEWQTTRVEVVRVCLLRLFLHSNHPSLNLFCCLARQLGCSLQGAPFFCLECRGKQPVLLPYMRMRRAVC